MVNVSLVVNLNYKAEYVEWRIGNCSRYESLDRKDIPSTHIYNTTCCLDPGKYFLSLRLYDYGYGENRKENDLTLLINGQNYCSDDDKTEIDYDVNGYNYNDYYDCGKVHIKGKAN